MRPSIGSFFGPIMVHHASYLVKTGRMRYAAQLLNEFGWIETNGVTGDWGSARFFKPQGQDISVQLTQYIDRDPRGQGCVDDAHLALTVHRTSAEAAANLLLDWAKNYVLGKDARIEKASPDGLKWFVFLPEIFTFALEIVQVDS